MVDCGSGQGRSDFETAGVAALRRGFIRSENTGLDHKMPFLGRYYFTLSNRSRWRSSNKCRDASHTAAMVPRPVPPAIRNMINI